MYLYFYSSGLSFVQIALLEAIYNVTTVLGEVPTGYLGDRVGRRNSLLLGTTLITFTLVGLGLAASFPAFAVLYACWSLGYAFRSGTEDAWVYETLGDAASEGAFTHVRGRGQSVALVVGVGASLLGGYLGAVNLAYPFFVAAAVTALGVAVLLTLSDPDEYASRQTLGVRESLRITREVLSRPTLRAFVVYYYVLFSAVSYLVFIFLQPVFESVVSDYALPFRVETLLGGFYALSNLLSAAVSYRLERIREVVGVRRWFLALPFVVGGGLATASVTPALLVPVLFLTRVVVEPTRSLAGQYVNDRIETLGRATVLSAMAMAGGLTVIPFQLAGGAVSDAASPSLALALAGGVLVVGSALVLLWESPLRTPAESTTEA
nr:MFS transporter [Halogeometricum limi]